MCFTLVSYHVSQHCVPLPPNCWRLQPRAKPSCDTELRTNASQIILRWYPTRVLFMKNSVIRRIIIRRSCLHEGNHSFLPNNTTWHSDFLVSVPTYTWNIGKLQQKMGMSLPSPAVPTRNTLKVTGFHSSGRPLWSWLSLCLLALFPSTYFSGGFICCGPFGLLQHLLYRGFYDFCWLFSSSLLHTTFKVSVKHPGMHFTLSSYVYFIPKLNVFDYSTIFYELGRTYFYRGDFSRPVSTSIPR